MRTATRCSSSCSRWIRREGIARRCIRVVGSGWPPHFSMSASINGYRLHRVGSRRSGASARLPQLQLIPVRIVAPDAGAARAPIVQNIRLKANSVGLETVHDGLRIRDGETEVERLLSISAAESRSGDI